MKKRICIFFILAMIFAITGCKKTAAQSGVESSPTEDGTTIKQSASGRLDGAETEEQETSPSAATPEQKPDMESKTLVVYFSATGTTKTLAEFASEILNADLYEIVPKEPYTESDLAYYTNARADQEQKDPSERPSIFGSVENMEEYDTIVLGYPIWHGQAPRIVSTFLESYDFSGKAILPFCTSHSSGIGSSADDLHPLCSDSAKWFEGRRFEAGTSKETMEEWLTIR